MFSMTTTEPITPPDMSAMSEINVPGVLISLGVGIAVWLVASFVISGITKRVAAGSHLLQEAALPLGGSRAPRAGPRTPGPAGPHHRCAAPGASWAS